ncbi:hypothetical protein GOHSU_28_00340 [Gordonia hirsuta DSM 44140 = NBRC 16056]|uniref:Uncharacterized protein n=1 Tax=Gordonia hirsuta DSM 44140 = NBRC 16056 TaxID=1121927 RepID=L7LAR5_9ACTN|nr:hypothetical protein [Gordonia hirsuta]GAC57979.1 hypothetical protein GOHSU_28_00340 [Gordonia hirsuta DSM 44140 = NBRC 16056]
MRSRLLLTLAGIAGVIVPGTVAVNVAQQVFGNDPCDSALPFAKESGLTLSGEEEVVSCEWHPGFRDSSGQLTVRTRSLESRERLLEHSGASEELARSWHRVGDGPAQQIVRRPNLERSEQVYTARSSSRMLSISYDDAVEKGLLLHIRAVSI